MIPATITRRYAPILAAALCMPAVAQSNQVGTVQLYAGAETELPILQARQQLTLEFDLLESNGRPLSVWFYHADKNWQRDLTPAEYLTSFQRDDLFEYRISRRTQIQYTHYEYRFPNESVGFRISGNYIVRVTERGREDEVLFERPFFVAENLTAPGFELDRLLVEQRNYPSIQPILTFRPPATLFGNVFDYTVCFIRNGQFDRPRCTGRPSLVQQPDLLFYLEPEEAFAAEEGGYYVDLSNLVVGARVERTDRAVSPFEILLSPDYARFPGGGLDPLLSGQAVIGDADRFVGDADHEGEYVQVTFRYAPPDEVPLPGPIYVVGSFSVQDAADILEWNPSTRFYEGRILLKQGRYEYRYTSPNAEVRRRITARLPRPDNLYTAFIYYRDTSLQTDRLLGFRHALSR